MKIIINIDDHTGLVKKVKTDVGRTRMNRAALELWKGNVQHTTWYKLRRFFKRLATEISARAELAARFCDKESVVAVPYIGLEEHHHG